MGILIAKVVSLPNETGKDVMDEYMERLAEEARASSVTSDIKLRFLNIVFEYMELISRNQLPDRSDQPLIMGELTIEIEGVEYNPETKLVKNLGKVPIYELRIDLHKPHWCFRATFFPKYIDGQLHYCFVYPFEKVAGWVDYLTDDYRDKTYEVLEDLRLDELKYAHYFSDE